MHTEPVTASSSRSGLKAHFRQLLFKARRLHEHLVDTLDALQPGTSEWRTVSAAVTKARALCSYLEAELHREFWS